MNCRLSSEADVLKLLRLTCRQFAYLKYINQMLFRKVRLVARLHDIRLLHEPAFRGIAPFVKEIIFESPRRGQSIRERDFICVPGNQVSEIYRYESEILGSSRLQSQSYSYYKASY